MQKQEEETKPAAEEEMPKTQEACEAKGFHWYNDACHKEPKPAPPPPAEGTEKNLVTRIMGVMEDVMNKKLGDFEKKIDAKIDTILKTKEVEVERALRKGFGLEEDPVVHMSDLISYGRKLGLQKAEPAKRTPGKQEAGPDGNSREHPVDALFKAFELKEAKA